MSRPSYESLGSEYSVASQFAIDRVTPRTTPATAPPVPAMLEMYGRRPLQQSPADSSATTPMRFLPRSKLAVAGPEQSAKKAPQDETQRKQRHETLAQLEGRLTMGPYSEPDWLTQDDASHAGSLRRKMEVKVRRDKQYEAWCKVQGFDPERDMIDVTNTPMAEDAFNDHAPVKSQQAPADIPSSQPPKAERARQELVTGEETHPTVYAHAQGPVLIHDGSYAPPTARHPPVSRRGLFRKLSTKIQNVVQRRPSASASNENPAMRPQIKAQEPMAVHKVKVLSQETAFGDFVNFADSSSDLGQCATSDNRSSALDRPKRTSSRRSAPSTQRTGVSNGHMTHVAPQLEYLRPDVFDNTALRAVTYTADIFNPPQVEYLKPMTYNHAVLNADTSAADVFDITEDAASPQVEDFSPTVYNHHTAPNSSTYAANVFDTIDYAVADLQLPPHEAQDLNREVHRLYEQLYVEPDANGGGHGSIMMLYRPVDDEDVWTIEASRIRADSLPAEAGAEREDDEASRLWQRLEAEMGGT